MGKLNSFSDWIKSNPLIVLVGALTPILGFVIGVSNLVPTTLRALNRPPCFTYADTYQDSFTEFRRVGASWHEYSRETGKVAYEFREDHRNPDFILLVNLTERREIPGWKSMLVRLPVCGGTAQMTVGVGQTWTDLFEIWRA